MYEWDPNKAEINLNKHGIDFADAVTVFEDEMALTIEDHDEFEERYVTLGADAFSRILVVVFTYLKDDLIRVISARKATTKERKWYEEG